MSSITPVRGLYGKNMPAILIGVALTTALGSLALAAQDRFTLQVPNGLAFAEFRGYENWRDVAVSQTEHGLKVISANDAMIDAYRSGVPGDGKPFPDGSKIAKIEWTVKKNAESPYFVNNPGHPEVGLVYREGHQEIPENAGMGVCPVRIRSRLRHVQAQRRGHRVRLCVPHDGGGKGLHLHRVSEEIKGGVGLQIYGTRQSLSTQTAGHLPLDVRT